MFATALPSQRQHGRSHCEPRAGTGKQLNLAPGSSWSINGTDFIFIDGRKGWEGSGETLMLSVQGSWR